MRKQFAFPIGWIYGDCWHRAVSDPVGRKGGPEGYQAGGRYGLGLDPLAGPGLQVIHPSDQEYGTQGDGENRRDQVAPGFASRQVSTWEPNTRRNSASSVTPSRNLSKASSIIPGQRRKSHI